MVSLRLPATALLVRGRGEVMQFPVQLHIGSLTIPLHAVMETLGIFIGFRLFLHQRKMRGDVIEESHRVWIIIGAIFGALIGSRLVGALEDPAAWFHSENALRYLYQNKTVVGGFLGGLFGVEGCKKFIGERKASGDLFVDKAEEAFRQLLCCLPHIHAPGLTYNNLFRIIIMRFIDAYDFDARAIKKSCVHIVHKDGRLIPFETKNLFYRERSVFNAVAAGTRWANFFKTPCCEWRIENGE